ncbi:hypothetical protein, partial [Bacillus velezensis]|uniref:hypothetical protein n=1 Tax=Bacillus velezensis TaxID=492670 RepID=UPI001C92EB1A
MRKGRGFLKVVGYGLNERKLGGDNGEGEMMLFGKGNECGMMGLLNVEEGGGVWDRVIWGGGVEGVKKGALGGFG